MTNSTIDALSLFGWVVTLTACTVFLAFLAVRLTHVIRWACYVLQEERERDAAEEN